MVTFTINKQKILMPTIKTELTLDQCQRIAKEVDFDMIHEDWLKLFNILTNKNFKVEDVEAKLLIINKLAPFIDGISFDEFMPEAVQINGKEIKIPKEVGNMVIGQALALKQSVSGFKYIDEGISKAVSIYLQPLVDGKKFSKERAKEVEQSILKMPAFLFYTLGNFILGQLRTNGIASSNPRSLILNSLVKVRMILRHVWLIIVVLPVTGIRRLLFVTLNCFRWILITFMKIALSVRFAQYLVIRKSTGNMKTGTQIFTTN